ncbi:hypothetical protein [uncultured Acinetobacter sp.]|uniref:hypothetical protein n=1 Tax=uncultured Acinetobacter sp. TaxID=165433 RepID=UPI00258974FD|nr:hypothetical protein [uncultured Acinetobacter sp.]
MKLQPQIIINLIMIVALIAIIYILFNQSKSNPQENDHETTIQSEPTQKSASEVAIDKVSAQPSASLTSSTQPIQSVKKSSNSVIKMQHCGANEYSVDCSNTAYPLIWFMYSADPRPNVDQIISIEFMKANQFKDLWIDELKISTQDNKSCQVVTWGADGENLTDEGLSIILDHCPVKQIKSVDLKIEGQVYRFT